MRNIAVFVTLIFVSKISIAQNYNKFRKLVNNNTEIAYILYPPEWILKDHAGMEMAFVRPQLSISDTVFRENFNLTLSGTMGYNSIETYSEALPEMLKGYIENFVREKSVVILIGKNKCSKTIYNYSKLGFNVRVALYQYMLHGQIYSITCTSTKDSFQKYESTFDMIGKSLSLQ